jgi:uncharacterized membrane protein YczE
MEIVGTILIYAIIGMCLEYIDKIYKRFRKKSDKNG